MNKDKLHHFNSVRRALSIGSVLPSLYFICKVVVLLRLVFRKGV
jgi:hypothetical protein